MTLRGASGALQGPSVRGGRQAGVKSSRGIPLRSRAAREARGLTLPGQMRAEPDDDIGTVHFAVSCRADVRGDFDRAVALLHHMMYVEARAAFEGIPEQAPDCAMAHWGVAATLFQPLWPSRPTPEELERGAAVPTARVLGDQGGGILEMEARQRAPGRDGERAVIDAYRTVDPK